MMTLRHIGVSLVFLLVMTLALGFAYPLVVTGVTQLLFPWRAEGSLLAVGGKLIGSRLIGQYFNEPNYFWGRPSSTSPNPYDASLSAASNLTPAGSALKQAIESRVKALAAADAAVGVPVPSGPVPADLVTSSGSGLDPDISPAAAYYQAARVAKARGLDPAAVRTLVDEHIRGRFLGLIGEPRVNVLALNLALDGMTPAKER